jgi:hypothetical protein
MTCTLCLKSFEENRLRTVAGSPGLWETGPQGISSLTAYQKADTQMGFTARVALAPDSISDTGILIACTGQVARAQTPEGNGSEHLLTQDGEPGAGCYVPSVVPRLYWSRTSCRSAKTILVEGVSGYPGESCPGTAMPRPGFKGAKLSSVPTRRGWRFGGPPTRPADHGILAKKRCRCYETSNRSDFEG